MKVKVKAAKRDVASKRLILQSERTHIETALALVVGLVNNIKHDDSSSD